MPKPWRYDGRATRTYKAGCGVGRRTSKGVDRQDKRGVRTKRFTVRAGNEGEEALLFPAGPFRIRLIRKE